MSSKMSGTPTSCKSGKRNVKREKDIIIVDSKSVNIWERPIKFLEAAKNG